jgi:hypothetical protein
MYDQAPTPRVLVGEFDESRYQPASGLIVLTLSPRASICARHPSIIALKTASSARRSETSSARRIWGINPGSSSAMAMAQESPQPAWRRPRLPFK